MSEAEVQGCIGWK